jgi:dihydrofolate reductase
MLNLIVAYEIDKRGIGINNSLPWHLPSDLKRFKELTEGHAVLMGSKTYESIGKALPNRENIILTRNRGYRADNCYIINYLAQLDVYMSMNPDKDVFVIGGSEIYSLMLPYVDRMYITMIDNKFHCDSFFKIGDEKEWENWNVTSATRHYHEGDQCPYTFVVYDRILKP